MCVATHSQGCVFFPDLLPAGPLLDFRSLSLDAPSADGGPSSTLVGVGDPAPFEFRLAGRPAGPSVGSDSSAERPFLTFRASSVLSVESMGGSTIFLASASETSRLVLPSVASSTVSGKRKRETG